MIIVQRKTVKLIATMDIAKLSLMVIPQKRPVQFARASLKKQSFNPGFRIEPLGF